jgi:[ribosomal protein S18]-alanine N-acetyltransferase
VPGGGRGLRVSPPHFITRPPLQQVVLGVLIRPFQPRDLDGVMALIQRQFGEVFRPDLYTSISQAWREAFLIVDTGEAIGGALIGIHDGPLTGRILIMVVDPPLRQRGVGARLMQLFVQRCQERSFRSVSLEVRAANVAAQNFYHRHGFRPIGLLPRYYNDGEDGVKMERVL